MEPAIETKVIHGHPLRTKTVERPDLALQFITAGSYTRPPGIPKAVTRESYGSKQAQHYNDSKDGEQYSFHC
jgi:hypothetical protein